MYQYLQPSPKHNFHLTHHGDVHTSQPSTND
jgi:hypothetical protein